MGIFIGWVIGVIVGLISGVALGRKYQAYITEKEEREISALQKPRNDREALKAVDEAGPVPTDPFVGPFLGDEVHEAEHKARLNERIAEDWVKGRKEYYQYMLTLTKNEDVNQVLYYIAVAGPDEYVSNRTVAKSLGWGTLRAKAAVEYAVRNRYLKVEDRSANKGSKYSIKEKAERPA